MDRERIHIKNIVIVVLIIKIKKEKVICRTCISMSALIVATTSSCCMASNAWRGRNWENCDCRNTHFSPGLVLLLLTKYIEMSERGCSNSLTFDTRLLIDLLLPWATSYLYLDAQHCTTPGSAALRYHAKTCPASDLVLQQAS